MLKLRIHHCKANHVTTLDCIRELKDFSDISNCLIIMSTILNPNLWIRPTRNHVHFLREGSVEEKDLLGLKGSRLCEMYRMNLPVPYAFTLSTQLFEHYVEAGCVMQKDWMDEIRYGVAKLEAKTGKKFGGTEGVVGERAPLLLSIRSSATREMPDMIQSILNLGMNRSIVDVLTAQTNNGRWALQTYIKFLRMFGTEVRGVDASKFANVIETVRNSHDPPVPFDSLLSIDDLNEIVEKFRLLTNVPDDPFEQLQQAIEGVLKAWNSTKARRFRDIQNFEDAGVAITVQCMVFGNQGVLSGTGVAVTRNPNSGKKELFGYYLANAEGDELLEQKRKPMSLEDLHTEQPEVYDRLMDAVNNLELHFKDAQEMEFTVENLQLFVLETSRAKRKPRASVQIAVDMVQEKILTEREALLRIEPAQMEYFLFPTVIDEFSNWKDAKIRERMLGVATHLTGGAVSGQVAFTQDQALTILERDDPCILVMRETYPGQEELLQSVSGLIVQRAGPTSHGIDTMRRLGKSSVACTPGMTLHSHGNSMTWCAPDGTEKEVKRGEVITIDGHTGAVYSGEVPTQKITRDDSFFTIMQWADRHKRMGVLATANSPHSLALANINGAEGIGLCTADRFFFLPEQIDLMRRFILADSALERSKFLVQMIPQLQQCFKEIFAMTGNCELSVRLMDSTLGDFLPHPKTPTFEKQVQQMAAHLGIPEDHCHARIQQLHSSNPLLGFHGAKLSVVYPEVTEMQIKAIVGAAVELNRRNFIALPQIILPGLVNELEVERVTSIISTVSDNVCAKAWTDSSFEQQYLKSRVGCMLATPRVCVQAANCAKSELICEVMFDTDVLTALVLGMDRDDSYNFVNTYVSHHIMAQDPFASLDLGGVGAIMQSAVTRIRSHKESFQCKIGVCGEHSSDPHSMNYFEKVGVHYVSCAPHRIPIAKVAAAQARILADMYQSTDKTAMRMF